MRGGNADLNNGLIKAIEQTKKDWRFLDCGKIHDRI